MSRRRREKKKFKKWILANRDVIKPVLSQNPYTIPYALLREIARLQREDGEANCSEYIHVPLHATVIPWVTGGCRSGKTEKGGA